jgi:hypothetical protein
MRYSVDSNVLQKVLNYIANRPYLEVSALVEQLQKDAIVIEESNTFTVPEKEANEN